MEAIKSFTSLEQSRKLAEILPIESADMYYMNGTKHVLVIPNYETDFFNLQEDDIPCWSLAALLNVMICPNLEEYIKGKWDLTTFTDESLKTPIEIQDYENPIDVCYEMILKLHE